MLRGRDVAEGPAAELRRRVGYVIQGIGLFPHWSVARNIGAVPRLLGWDAGRIEARVDELLGLLRLDPGASIATAFRANSRAARRSAWGWRARWRRTPRSC